MAKLTPQSSTLVPTVSFCNPLYSAGFKLMNNHCLKKKKNERVCFMTGRGGIEAYFYILFLNSQLTTLYLPEAYNDIMKSS